MIVACVEESVWKTIQGYEVKQLPKLRKDTLINVVAQAVLIYIMSIFRLTNGYFEEISVISSLLVKFIGHEKKNTLAHLGVFTITEIHQRNGLQGPLCTLNEALLAKQHEGFYRMTTLCCTMSLNPIFPRLVFWKLIVDIGQASLGVF